jgi:hypothetical protein
LKLIYFILIPPKRRSPEAIEAWALSLSLFFQSTFQFEYFFVMAERRRHVVRFLGHPLLPANTPSGFPKIIKHGNIYILFYLEHMSHWAIFLAGLDGTPMEMHPKSPRISAIDGAVTLMFKMGKDDWLERFLDVKGTSKFELVMREKGTKDVYIRRYGCDTEVGIIFNLGTTYLINWGTNQVGLHDVTDPYVPPTQLALGVRYRASLLGNG